MKDQSALHRPARSIGIWIRVSTDDQAQGDSPKHHEARARHFAASREWQVAEVYDLAGVSGKAVMEHPETKRMLEDVRRGHVSALVFSKLARLTRNARELMEFSDFFREHNADLISLQENIDTSTPSGRLFYNMVAVMAQWEREEIADRVNASIGIRAKLGKPLNGKAPYGYYWKDKKLIPHPEEAPVRKLIYELFLEHQRKRTVARILNERGLRVRKGARFSDTTVGRLLQDPTAKGIHRANYTKRIAGDKPWALKPEHEWVLTKVQPVVSEDLWQQCNDLLEALKVTQVRPTKRAVHTFAGVTLCTCGKKMYVPSNSPKYICMTCRNKIPIVDLEALFLERVQGFMASPDALAEYFDRTAGIVADKQRLFESIRTELGRVAADADRTYQLYLDGGLDVKQFKERYQPLDDRKKQLEADLPKVEAEVDALKINSLSGKEVASKAKDLPSRWKSMTPDERRQLIEITVKEIIIGENTFDVTLYELPIFKEVVNRQRTL